MTERVKEWILMNDNHTMTNHQDIYNAKTINMNLHLVQVTMLMMKTR